MPMSLMNIGKKNLPKIQAKQFNHTLREYIPLSSGIYLKNSWVLQICKLKSVIHINKLKNKNHTIISIDAEKDFYTIQMTHILTKTVYKVGIEGTYIKLIKAINDKPTANTILNGETKSIFSLRSGTIQGCPLGSLLITMDLEVLAMAIREELKKKKKNPNWKRRGKTLTVCRYHETIHRKS